MMDIYSRDVRLLKPWKRDEPEAMDIVSAFVFMCLWNILLSVVPLLLLLYVFESIGLVTFHFLLI